MKKVLILTASTGGGHNMAAQSLCDEFAGNDYITIRYDFLKQSSQLLNTLVVDGYKLLAFKCPRLYGNLYRFCDFNGFNSKISNIISDNIKENIIDVINDVKPDIIIGTHAFAVTIISNLKKTNVINIPFISVVTDFKAHYAYIDDGVDAYITGSEYTKLSMIRRNVPQYKIFPYGIPIRKDFLSGSKSELKDKVPGDYFNILLMGGGTGMKFIIPVLKKLSVNEHKLKITVVCGNNESLEKSLNKMFDRNIENKVIEILGYTKNISELMDESDVIITKPGGLTVSEAIARRLPMLIPYAIPGQEQENRDFLISAGAAVDASSEDKLSDALDKLIKHPDELNKIRKNLDNITGDYSIESIVNLSNNLIEKYKRFNIPPYDKRKVLKNKYSNNIS